MEKKPWYRSKAVQLLITTLLIAHLCHAQVSPADFRYMEHLNGYWTMKTKHSVFTEKWHQVNDNLWKGITWRITGKDSVQMDEMELGRYEDGIYFRVTAISDEKGKPIPFKLTKLLPVGFVAENPACDYPQKVIYKWKDAKHLEAHFSGTKEKTFSEIILLYER